MKPLDEADRDADSEHAHQAASRSRRDVPQRRPRRAGDEGRSRAGHDRDLPACRAERGGVRRAVSEAIAETGATSAKEMGKVMKAAQAKLAGKRVDGKVLSERVKSRLS